MEYRNLGSSGLKVSPLCLGAMLFGGVTDEATSGRIVAHARAQGVNFIDTADVYNDGRSEEVVGRAIAADRDWWVVATKCTGVTGPGPNDRGASRTHVMRAAEASLRRLGTGTIDIFYLHRDDLSAPLSETVHAMADLVRGGKIRHFGVSNFRAWRLGELCRLCDEAGIDRPVVSQPLYNALNRTIELEHLPACAHFGLGVFPYSPLARGVLTGKYQPGLPPQSGTRAGRQDRRMLETEWREESLHIAAGLTAHAAARGVTPGQFALAWVLHNRLVTGAIAGPRTEAQWEEYVGALDCRLTAEDEALVDRLVTPGHASTHGYVDPMDPPPGRSPRSV
jgi:aryl-alcohol dehydrogenase-like predicted oxidoreductase